MDPLPALELSSWEAFMSQVTQVGWGMPTRPGHVFRGQGNQGWVLEPSLLRTLRGVTQRQPAEQLEERIEREFFSQAHLYSAQASALKDSVADWQDRLALMQHHGVPTRLLDWTTSPMVAAYFACATALDQDGAVFVASPIVVNSRVKERLGSTQPSDDTLRRVAEDGPLLMFFSPSLRSERHVTQQGHFSMSSDILATHDLGLVELLRPGTGPSGPAVVAAKWIIPQRLKLTFLGHLRQMNVAGHSLFPGLDGLGRSLTEAVLVERTMMM